MNEFIVFHRFPSKWQNIFIFTRSQTKLRKSWFGRPWWPKLSTRILPGNFRGTSGELPGKDPPVGTLSTDPRRGVGGGYFQGTSGELPGNFRGTSRHPPQSPKIPLPPPPATARLEIISSDTDLVADSILGAKSWFCMIFLIFWKNIDSVWK